MANNVFAKAEKLAAAALGLLDRQSVLGGIVTRDAGDAFTGAKNDTVNIRRPSVLVGAAEALTRDTTREIATENLNEWTIPVKLDTHAYSAVDLSDAELTLDVEDFGAQVLDPQVKAISRRVEKGLAAKFATAPAIGTVPVDKTTLNEVTPGAVRAMIVKARNVLNKNDVPLTGRFLVVGADVESCLLNDPTLLNVDQSGSDSVLREAILGRLRGFTIVTSNDVDPGQAIALHPTAYILVNRAPVVPTSAQGATRSFADLSLRVMRDYNSKTASDRSFVSTYMGIGEVLDAPAGTAPGQEASKAVQLRAVSFKLAPTT